jgi:hypothetical protein
MKNIAIVVLCLFSNFVQSKAETTPTNLSIEAEKTVSADAYFPVLKPGSWIGVKQGAVQHLNRQTGSSRISDWLRY